MDENLNTISLRMYNEANKPGDYSVKVEEVTLAGKQESLFYRKICDLIDTTKDPWKKFSFTTSQEVLKREKYLHDLRYEQLERKRVNEARKVDMQSMQG